MTVVKTDANASPLAAFLATVEGLADQCRMRVADGHWVESQVAIDLISASVGGASQDVS